MFWLGVCIGGGIVAIAVPVIIAIYLSGYGKR